MNRISFLSTYIHTQVWSSPFSHGVKQKNKNGHVKKFKIWLCESFILNLLN
jgi:hypothetical protein